jgi:hypothetical protein
VRTRESVAERAKRRHCLVFRPFGKRLVKFEGFESGFGNLGRAWRPDHGLARNRTARYIDAFRTELARRIDAFVASRMGEEAAADDSAPAPREEN